MNVKKKLENRIKGWFPEEPRLKNTPQLVVQPSNTNQKNESQEMNSTQQRPARLIFTPLFTILAILYLLSFPRLFKISWQIEIVFAILGAAMGIFIGLSVTRRELELLSQNGKISAKKIKLSTTPFLVAFIGLVIFLYLYNQMYLGIFATVGLVFAASSSFANLFLCSKWENASRKRIYIRSDGEFFVANE